MFVLNAAMGWLLAGAVLGLVLVVGVMRAARRRRQGWDRHSVPSILVPLEAASPAHPSNLAESAQPAEPAEPTAPATAARERGGAPALAADAPAARLSAGPQNIRAELAAHAERLAAARAARAAATAQAAAAAAARSAHRLRESAAAEPAVFDPTRSAPWQQVADSVARARAGLPSTAGATEALRAAVAAGQPGDPTRADAVRTASVKPGEFMVRTAVPRVPPLNPIELGARPRHILVVDDARVVRVKLQRLLLAQGWQVSEAADGDEALRLLASQMPDLLITDVAMPGLDGFALTRAVRADAGTARLPVVMITAADDEHRDEAARAGVTVLLGKPYGEEALLAHMRRLMGLQPVAATTVAGALDALPA